MKSSIQKKNIDIRIVLFAFSLFCFHIAIVNNHLLSGVVSFIEFSILAFFLLKKKIEIFLSFFIIIISSSFEYSLFVDETLGTVFSPINLPFLMGYPFLFISLLPTIEIINQRKIFLKKLYKSTLGIQILYKFSFSTICIGVIIGLFCFVTNDNDISAFGLTFFFKDFSRLCLFSLFIIYFIFCSLMSDNFLQKIEIVLFSVLVSCIFASLFSFLGGFKGYYGSGIILMPLSFFFSTSIFLFLLYKKYYYKNKLLLIILTSIAYFIQISYSNALSGKSWLVLLLYFIAILIILYNKSKLTVIIIAIFTISISSLFISTIQKRKSNDSLSSTKMMQALAVLTIADIDWYDNMPLSPKIRFEEFFNTVSEYTKKPYHSIFGKGYGGSHKDHRNSYGNYNPAAFSLEEYNKETFVLMHETFNTVYLKFGLYGILFLLFICIKGATRFFKSPWLIIGVIWLLFFFGYSFSLAAIGVPALVLGFNSIDN